MTRNGVAGSGVADETVGSKGRVLVTRPAGQAAALCSAVEAAGYTAHSQPLLELQALSELPPSQRQLLLDLERYQHVIFVSGNAVRFGLACIEDYWPQVPVGLTWYAIGDATAALLHGFGIEAVTPGKPMTSEGLLGVPQLQAVADQRILIIKGEGGRTTLREELMRRGATVDELACYRRACPDLPAGELAARLHQWRINLVMISSGEGLANLQMLLRWPETTKFRDICVIVPSQRIARLAQKAGFEQVVTAENASDVAMLHALEEWKPGSGERCVSDKEQKNIEYAVEAARKSDAALDEPAAAVKEPRPPAPASPARARTEAKRTPAPRKASSAIAWLALLLVLALAGGAAWSVLEMQRREAALIGRVQELEGAAGQKEANLQELGQHWQGQLQTGLGELKDELAKEASRQALALESVESQLAEQRQELARFSASDRESWLLAEAQYLLRLANQRLIMAGDTVAAQALLSSADNVLRKLDDVGLHGVRGAVAADLAAVRAVPAVDVEGIYLRLAALIEQAGKLVIFQLPESESQPRPDTAPPDWQARLQEGYEDALTKLSDYVIIRRRDVPVQALMDPQWEGLVRQNLRMLLEQAQVALLSGNQSLYSESLQRAQHWVGEFFESDEAAARAMAREITQLTDAIVAVTMPDISRSLRALEDAVEQGLQRGGDE